METVASRPLGCDARLLSVTDSYALKVELHQLYVYEDSHAVLSFVDVDSSKSDLSKELANDFVIAFDSLIDANSLQLNPDDFVSACRRADRLHLLLCLFAFSYSMKRTFPMARTFVMTPSRSIADRERAADNTPFPFFFPPALHRRAVTFVFVFIRFSSLSRSDMFSLLFFFECNYWFSASMPLFVSTDTELFECLRLAGRAQRRTFELRNFHVRVRVLFNGNSPSRSLLVVGVTLVWLTVVNSSLHTSHRWHDV